MFEFSPESGLAGLFAASVLSATLLPGGSEVVLVGIVEKHPAWLWPAVAVATAGNTLGGIATYLIGRLLPRSRDGQKRSEQVAVSRLERYGPAALLMAWLPVVGDALPLAAGWLRLPLLLSAIALAIGKFARYAVVGFGWDWITG